MDSTFRSIFFCNVYNEIQRHSNKSKWILTITYTLFSYYDNNYDNKIT